MRSDQREATSASQRAPRSSAAGQEGPTDSRSAGGQLESRPFTLRARRTCHREGTHGGIRWPLLLVAASCFAGACSDDAEPPPEEEQATCEPGDACTSVESECLALVDNSDVDKAGLRVSQLTVTRPSVLADGIVGRQVARRVELDRPECYLTGDGTFSWLIEVDKATGTVRTGGAPPADPEGGYCFVNGMLNGVPVAPVEVQVDPIDDQGSFTVRGFDVTLPIYLDTEGSSVVLLPLRQVSVTEGRITDDFNCVGRHNPDLTRQTQCVGTPEVPPFEAGAQLEGFITLEDADTVDVAVLGASLCVVLSEDAATYGDGGTPLRCKRDGGGAIVLQGDWCSTTNTEGGCRDAFRLGGELAASAVKINGGC